MLVVATPEHIQEKLTKEINDGRFGFHQVWNIYSQATLEACLEHEVLSPEFLVEKLQQDLQHPPGVDLLTRMALYGAWIARRLNVPREYIRDLLLRDSDVLQYEFTDLVRRGAEKLLAESFLTREFLHDKFMAQLASRGMPFGLMVEKCQWVLDKGVVSPAELLPAFLQERDTMTLVEFLDKYWEWPLSKYRGQLCRSDKEYAKLAQLQAEFAALQQSYKRNVESTTNAFAVKIAAAEAKKARRQSEAEEKSSRAATKASKVDEKQASSGKAAAKTLKKAEQKAEKAGKELTKALSEYVDEVAALTAEQEAALTRLKNEFEREKLALNRAWNDWRDRFDAPATPVPAQLVVPNIQINVTTAPLPGASPASSPAVPNVAATGLPFPSAPPLEALEN